MPAATRRRATYADIEALPSNVVGEILDGELVTHPRPLPRHGVAAFALSSEIGGPFPKRVGGPGGWIFLAEPELHLGDQIVEPDIAGWRRERMSSIADQVGITLAPDWLCEVISPLTASYDRTVKLRIYHQHKVRHLWYVHPGYRTLEVFGWSEAHWLALGSSADFETASAPPFESLKLEWGVLWPFDSPTAPPET